jgi:L-malate glycosyltransferase
MRVLISLEHRFFRTPDGRFWTATNNAYSFWVRYLEVFDHVDVLARVQDVAEPEPAWQRADGAGVTFVALPHFVGPQQYARHFLQVNSSIQRQAEQAQAVIARVPSLVGQVLLKTLRRRKHPYGLEVVGDPYDVFAPRAGVRHPMRAFFRSWFSSQLRTHCMEAKAVAYVTQQALQHRYPSRSLMMGVSDVFLPNAAFTTSYSSVELDGNSIVKSAPEQHGDQRQVLVFIGSLEQLYKAPDVLIKAAARAVAQGVDLELCILGDGQYRESLQLLAQQSGLEGRCRFLGVLPSGPAVQNVLDTADLFVLPSRVEALPRALIEAMARGLPCIGSTVGGIPELLDADHLVPPDDEVALAEKIVEMVKSPEKRRMAAERNLREADKYRDESLRQRRVQFYKYIADATAEWMAEQATSVAAA